jgi:myosin-5
MINKTTSAKFDGKTTNDIDNDGDRIIALLDIFGFETFKVNRFEQLCINFANEKLQQKFTQDVFQAVQSEYKEEGLEWEAIGYKDNEEVLDLLEGRYGVLTLLNEECMIPKGNDMNYLGRLNTACAKHPCFMTGHLLARDEFCVVHFAGKVAYSVTGFLDSNKDTLPPDIRSLMNSSTNSIIAGVYNQSNKTAVNPANRKASPKLRRVESFMKADTVTIKFRSQLDRLMIEIGMTDVQYVRCIKPNSLKSSTVFDRPMVFFFTYSLLIDALTIFHYNRS